MIEETRVRRTDVGAVRVLTLSRPEKKNAFDVPQAAQVWRAIEDADADESVRVIVVTAEGDYFSGGADVNLFLQFANTDPADIERVAHLYKPLRQCKKPT
ncbi:MAG TPA: enoyl-CoA hydratase/isomerase family protein, partial [Polyangiaceae bacterium]|nr:enoyl-CoA hydratase/isomerase family protein [Polyangiaceae bacterium]